MTLEEVKRIPMADIVQRYGFRPNRAGFIHCPFHNGDRGASMKIYQNDAHCFGCGWNGDAIDFVAKMDDLSFKEAFLVLGGSYEHEDKTEIRRKIQLAEQRRREKDEKEAEERRKRSDLAKYITLLRTGIEYFPVYSDEWCTCQNELPKALYRWDIMTGLEVEWMNETAE